MGLSVIASSVFPLLLLSQPLLKPTKPKTLANGSLDAEAGNGHAVEPIITPDDIADTDF